LLGSECRESGFRPLFILRLSVILALVDFVFGKAMTAAQAVQRLEGEAVTPPEGDVYEVKEHGECSGGSG
jgi:hypothetical protein